jgi:nitroreductase
MNTIEAILTRRSVRAYSEKEVSDEVVEDLLKAAMQAPSAKNAQPWHFIVIRDKKILNEIPKFHKTGPMIAKAPLAILICADLELENQTGCWMLDCSAAAENLLLAAHEKGLGGVWTACYPINETQEGMRKLFDLPDNIVPHSIIPIGYPAHPYNPKSYYQEKRVHHDRWQ